MSFAHHYLAMLALLWTLGVVIGIFAFLSGKKKRNGKSIGLAAFAIVANILASLPVIIAYALVSH